MTAIDSEEMQGNIANLLAAGIDIVVGNLSPVFDTILEKAMGLRWASFLRSMGSAFSLQERAACHPR